MDITFDLLLGDHFHVILHPDKEHGIIFNRLDRTVTVINYDDAKELGLKYVGRVYGIVGRFLDKYLVLIKERSKIGSLYDPNSKTDHDVYVITQVQVIEIATSNNGASSVSSKSESVVKYDATFDRNNDNSISRDHPPIELKTSDSCDSFSSLPITINTNSYLSAQSRSNNWNPFKLAHSLKPMLSSQLLKTAPTESQPSESAQTSSRGCDSGESRQFATNQSSQADNSDRRLVDEMTKLFNNTNSFYYSPTLDLTNHSSRKNLIRKVGNEAVWETADERFFWNKYMLNDLIELSKEDNDANHFICVILQGFIAIQQYSPETCRFSRGSEDQIGGTSLSKNTNTNSPNYTRSNTDNKCDTSPDGDHCNVTSTRANFSSRTYQLALVSRRSVFQAGTRYRRRGCDENGHCANFVETEQIFKSNQHYTSLVMIRGSIPLFWYQTGYNYRPPPVLSRSEEENHQAFSKHFLDLFRQYGTEQIVSIDCTEQSGREKILHEAFKRHMDRFRETHPRTKLIQFDYHKYCRGRQCTQAQIEEHMRACGLTEQTLKDIKYYWNDGDVVLNQDGVFRVNCLDCSDRTNVVQRIIALQILDLQLARLGIIVPDTSIEENECKRIMQTMWSTNGNVLSTQYCGTRALFGGERKLAGYIKDTYSSASRYYISKFRDVYRQAAIDAMLGIENLDATNIVSGTFKDPYELPNFDPLLASRTGGAILRDVGSRVTNRLARLKGRFNARTFSQLDSGAGARVQRPSSAMIETGLAETIGEMSIDWPSSENVDSPLSSQPIIEAREAHDVFAQYANCDDSFQDDDEFGQLMLSIDVAELQRLREEEEAEAAQEADSSNLKQQFEEIDMKEARGNNLKNSKQQQDEKTQKIKTTST